MGLVPDTAKVSPAAVTLVTSNGRRLVMVRSIISTSSTKTSPAIGALKMPATAPAAPQPTSSIIYLPSNRHTCPRLLPMALPVRTIGASAPTLPPKPMVMAEATMEVQVLCFLMRLCLRAMANSIFVTP